MDDFNYLQDDVLVKWVNQFFPDYAPSLAEIQDEFLPRFERDIYMNAASKLMSAGKRSVDALVVSESE